jgi:hypothetical protein
MCNEDQITERRYLPGDERYPMCASQPVQLECRLPKCKYHGKPGECLNPAPAITLHHPIEFNPELGTSFTFVCWSRMIEG